MTNNALDQSILGWISKNKIINERGFPIEFDSHYFLLEPYANWFPKQVCMKSAQVGWSTLAILKTLYAMRFKGFNTIYTLPSFDDVRDFVPAKVDGMISNNPYLVTLLGKSDAIMRKQFGGNFIWYRGTHGKKAAIMHTSDLNVHDELDASKLDVVDLYASRVQASQYKGEWKFSNPIRPGGIDREYGLSDQRRWRIQCGRCNRDQVLEYKESVCQGRLQYVCKHCDEVLSEQDRHDGIWIPDYPSRSNELQGYHVNQLMAPWVDAKHLVYLEKTKTPGYFYNMVLGLPYIDEQEIITSDIIYNNITSKPNSKLRNAMGVDVKYREKHYVIGNHEGIFEVGVAKGPNGWDEIIKLKNKYNAVLVADMNPDFFVRRKLLPMFPGSAHACSYRQSATRENLIEWSKQNNGYVYGDRSQLIQWVVDSLMDGHIKFSAGARSKAAYMDSELGLYMQHWKNIYKKVEENNMGIMQSSWEKKGDDDFVHATVYWHIALTRVAKINPSIFHPGTGLSPFVFDDTIPADRIPVFEETKDPDAWKYI